MMTSFDGPRRPTQALGESTSLINYILIKSERQESMSTTLIGKLSPFLVGVFVGWQLMRYAMEMPNIVQWKSFEEQSACDADQDDQKVSSLSAPTTVTFCIGGKRYTVSRTLLNEFPESILAKKAKEMEDSMSIPIIFYRDGNRFRYCLDYMRDQRVSLPIGISKRALLQDLKFYGVPVHDINAIDTSCAHAAAGKHVLSHVKDVREKLRRVEGCDFVSGLMEQMALNCFHMYAAEISRNPSFEGVLKFFDDHESKNWSEHGHQDILNQCLANYGLICTKSTFGNEPPFGFSKIDLHLKQLP